MRFKLIEDYIYIDGKEYYDFGTAPVNTYSDGNLKPDIFDTSTLGGYHQHSIIPENIHLMTPRQYLEYTAEDRGVSFNSEVKSIEKDEDSLQLIRDVLFKLKRKLPMCYISKKHPYIPLKQEGRHRMYVAAELFGWDKSFPVLIVD